MVTAEAMASRVSTWRISASGVGVLGVCFLIAHGDVFRLGDGPRGQDAAHPALGIPAEVCPQLVRRGAVHLAVELQRELAAVQLALQLLHVALGVLVQHSVRQRDGQVGPGHVQQGGPGKAVGVGFVDGALPGTDIRLQRFQRIEAQLLCQGVVHSRGLLLLHAVQGDLELCRLAGKLRHPELGRVSKVEPEAFTRLVAVDSLLGGRHQLAGAQQHGDVLHLAVRDGLAAQKALKIQRDAHPAGGRLLHRGKRRMGPGKPPELLLHRFFRDRAHPAGDGQPLILPKRCAGHGICSWFHQKYSFSLLSQALQRFFFKVPVRRASVLPPGRTVRGKARLRRRRRSDNTPPRRGWGRRCAPRW